MAQNHDLQNQSVNLDTKATNADIRNKIANVRATIADAGVVEQAIVMFQTGFDCTMVKGELTVWDGENGEEPRPLPHDARGKYCKMLVDKYMPTPTSIVKEDEAPSELLDTLTDMQAKIDDDNAKERAMRKLIVIEPEPDGVSTPAPTA